MGTGPQITLWWADLDLGDGELAALHATLSARERERAARLIDVRHRRRFITARGRLRELLGAELGCDPVRVPLAVAPDGKPYCPGAALRFNLSHSAGTALYGISASTEVGVDVETLRPPTEMDGIARRCFTAAEQERLAALPSAERHRGFLECWTRKEAYAKGIGTDRVGAWGVVEVWLGDARPADLGEWSIHRVSGVPDCVAAIAIRDAPGWIPPAASRMRGISGSP